MVVLAYFLLSAVFLCSFIFVLPPLFVSLWHRIFFLFELLLILFNFYFFSIFILLIFSFSSKIYRHNLDPGDLKT